MNSNNLTYDRVKRQKRVVSLDALRGFDMLWIIGLGSILRHLFSKGDSQFWQNLAAQFYHTDWVGIHFWDTIFPMFIFMVGMSLTFSITRKLERGDKRKKLYLHIIKRSVVLFVLGLICGGVLDLKFSEMGYPGVLQRIAVAYFFAALIVMNTKVKTQAIVAGSLLILYWALMTFVPVPGYGAGVLSPDGNLHAYIDRLVLPGKLYNGTYDEDGLLQQMSSVAMALFGAVAGHWLQRSDPPGKKLLGYWGGGLAFIFMGLIWHYLPRPLGFPLIFRLWSSSFVLVTAGYSAIMFGLFYWILDVRARKKWAFPLVVIGLNAITIYFGQRMIDFGIFVDFFVHGFKDYLGDFKPLFMSICYLIISWLILYFLYKKKIFLKV